MDTKWTRNGHEVTTRLSQDYQHERSQSSRTQGIAVSNPEGHLTMPLLRLLSQRVHMPLHDTRQQVTRRLLGLTRIHSPIRRIHHHTIPRQVQTSVKRPTLTNNAVRSVTRSALISTTTTRTRRRHNHVRDTHANSTRCR